MLLENRAGKHFKSCPTMMFLESEECTHVNDLLGFIINWTLFVGGELVDGI